MHAIKFNFLYSHFALLRGSKQAEESLEKKIPSTRRPPPAMPATARCLLLLCAIATAALTACVRASVLSGFTVARQFEFLGKFCFTWTPTLEELAGVRLDPVAASW